MSEGDEPVTAKGRGHTEAWQGWRLAEE